jgi:hypothetical protein
MAGNKSDLSDMRQVPTQEAREYADEINAVFCECSAKSSERIHQLFRSVGIRCAEGDLAHVRVREAAAPQRKRNWFTRTVHTEYTLSLQIHGGDELSPNSPPGQASKRFVDVQIKTRYKHMRKLHAKLSKTVADLPAIPPRVRFSRQRRLATATVDERQGAFVDFFRHALAKGKDAAPLKEFIAGNACTVL